MFTDKHLQMHVREFLSLVNDLRHERRERKKKQKQGDNLLDILGAVFKNFPVALTLVLNEGETYFLKPAAKEKKVQSENFHLAKEFFHHFRFN